MNKNDYVISNFEKGTKVFSISHTVITSLMTL